MKILKIFGIVVAVHAVAFMFVFAIPGCRSTSRQVSPALATETTSKPSSEATAPDRAAGPGAPTQPSGSPSVNGADLNPGVSPSVASTSGAGDTGIRFNRNTPTRPGTPVAAALETPPVADVTPAKTYVVAKGDSLSLIAKKNGVAVKDLLAANNLKKDAVLVAGKKLIIPSKAATPTPTETPTAASSPGAPSSSAETLTYVVKSGDTLDRIAKHSGTTVAAIKNLNKLKNDNVHVDQKLTIPVGPGSASVLAAAHEADPTVNSASATATASGTPPAGGTTYVVKQGEPLAAIAKKFGVRLSDIAAANNISDPKKLRAGQTLVIPAPTKGKSTPATATASTPTPTPASSPVSNATAPSPVSSSSPTPDTASSSPLSAPSTETVPPINKVEEPGATAPAKN